MSAVNSVDVVYDVAWGDSGKGKISSFLAKRKNKNNSNYYKYVARWNGGSNAGHTIWFKDQKYATHLIPSGIFHSINSLIGPGCVVNIESFYSEVSYLKEFGFDTSLIKVHPNAHVVKSSHILEDK
jgi:adenylosuccinate synthase